MTHESHWPDSFKRGDIRRKEGSLGVRNSSTGRKARGKDWRRVTSWSHSLHVEHQYLPPQLKPELTEGGNTSKRTTCKLDTQCYWCTNEGLVGIISGEGGSPQVAQTQQGKWTDRCDNRVTVIWKNSVRERTESNVTEVLCSSLGKSNRPKY
jgi:hypothetical protein